MKWTRASVEVQKEAQEPVSIDGIPDGFAWKEADVTISGKEHTGKYVLFEPLGDRVARADTQDELLTSYNFFKKEHAKANTQGSRSQTKN